MKKLLLFIALGVCITSDAFATKILVVNRTRINGDGSGNYRDVTRGSETGTNAAGDEVTIVSIGCAEPGTNGCPRAKPAGTTGGGDPAGHENPALLNYVEVRMAEIDGLIEHGVTVGGGTRVVVIQQVDGKYKQYRVTDKWNCTIKAGTMSVTLEELEKDVVTAD